MKFRVCLIVIIMGVMAATVFAEDKAGGAAVLVSGRDLQREIQREFERHDFKKVIKIYKDYAGAHPDEVIPFNSRVLYSQSLASSGEVKEAIDHLEKVLEDFSPETRFVRLQYDLANLLMMERRYPEARKAFERVIFETTQDKGLVSKARERLAQMKDKESKKKDVSNLQLIEIETALEAGQVPDGVEEVLKQIQSQNANSPMSEQAKKLMTRYQELRSQKAQALLDEARRLFDVERKFGDVRVLLDQIKTDYPDFGDMQSVEALLKLVDQKVK